MSEKSTKKRPLEKTDKEQSNSKKSSVIKNIIPSKTLNTVDKLKDAWMQNKDYHDSEISVKAYPFRHGVCKGFVENEDFLEEFVEKFDTFEFHEKSSDLFQFRQSNDLKSYVDPHIHKIMEYLKDKVLPWLQNVTTLPLNGDIDLFLSDYRKNDFLLCHDDELDSRRIAFILYLSKDWKQEFGGNLDLFSATKDIRPKEIDHSISPEFNKFAFFEVGVTSFHQVSEVTADGVKRLALSGWFYGDPIPRPKITFQKDEGYNILSTLKSFPNILTALCTESYLTEETQQDINEQISEESQVLIPGFLKNDAYKNICNDIVEQDVENSIFSVVGPPNVQNFLETSRGPPSVREEEDTSPNIDGLQKLFHSKQFFEFLEKITELPFTTSTVMKGTSSLRKFTKGCYSLLRSGGAKQTGNLPPSKEGGGGEEEEENEEDPNLLDIMFFMANKWEDGNGGLIIYSTEEGEQLITVSPEGNCLALVVRNSSVNSYVNYINCNAGEEVYFVYTMTCALDGNL